jgi:hypothetical protein
MSRIGVTLLLAAALSCATSADERSCDGESCTALCLGSGRPYGMCMGDSCWCGGELPDGGGDASEAGGEVDAETDADSVAPDDSAARDDGEARDGAETREDGDSRDDGSPRDDSGLPPGSCGGPFTGSGSGGESGAVCLETYGFSAIAGNLYVISTCGSFSGDTYLAVRGACTCESDDECDLGSECSCIADYDGEATICASTYDGDFATWSYTVSGDCGP